MIETDQLRECLLIAETKIVQLEAQLEKYREALQRLSERHSEFKDEQKTHRTQQSPGRREMVYRRCKGECFYCATAITFDEFSVDHVMPLARGGSNLLQNLVASCVRCNNRKGDRIPTDQELERAESIHTRPPQSQQKKAREPEPPINPLDKAFAAMQSAAKIKTHRVKSRFDHRNRHHGIGSS